MTQNLVVCAFEISLVLLCCCYAILYYLCPSWLGKQKKKIKRWLGESRKLMMYFQINRLIKRCNVFSYPIMHFTSQFLMINLVLAFL